MIAEKTIKLCGQEVRMRYCAASETGYEQISDGKSATVFSANVTEYDADGKPSKIEPPTATTGDYIILALASIIAAYERTGEKSPVSDKDILFDATPAEVTALITTVVELRNKWYQVPATVKPEVKEDPETESPKNAQQPATDSN